MAATTALREALNQGISSGNLIDTKIILYSRRDSLGRICRPKPLYANSNVLKKVPYFEGLLFGNFAESQSKDFKEAIDEDEFAENYGYISDSDLEDDEDERPSFKHAGKSKVYSFGPFPAPSENNFSCERNEEHVSKGKVVKIPDIAFVTFQSFLMYLYTDTIEFAPFGLEQNRRSRSAEMVDPSDNEVPRPSPKSIYRLADKYDVPELKTLSLNCIRSELGKCDIVEEAFGRFASQYTEIRTIYVSQLAYAWVGDPADATRVKVDKKIDSFAEGDLEHATEMLAALWKIANKDGTIAAPSNVTPAVTQITSPANWSSVKMALAKSIRTGVFFDRKYWVRHLKSGDALKPIYFSSTIMEDKAQQLNKLVKYLKGQDTSISDLEEGANIESDCEGDSQEIEKDVPKVKEERKEETRAVLITGSFAAWRSLFFYRCTDVILFAPLQSQGVDARLNYIREKTVAATPPPCSPKSIYVLGSLLEIQPLCDSAFADIKSKVTECNVVSEVFSWVTAVQEKILEMECELLISNFKNPKTIDLVGENIGRISSGSSSHAANALKLGLKKAFDRKKIPPGVKLRCSNVTCPWYNNPDTYSKMTSYGNYCQMCSNRGWSYYLQCSGCSFNRASSYTTCQSCRKNFAQT